MSVKKRIAVFAMAAVLVLGIPTAAMEQDRNQDGLVNVSIGDVTILENVDVVVAANVVANVCALVVAESSCLQSKSMRPVLASTATREEAAEQSQSPTTTNPPTTNRPVKGYEGERASALSPSASIARHTLGDKVGPADRGVRIGEP